MYSGVRIELGINMDLAEKLNKRREFLKIIERGLIEFPNTYIRHGYKSFKFNYKKSLAKEYEEHLEMITQKYQNKEVDLDTLKNAFVNPYQEVEIASNGIMSINVAISISDIYIIMRIKNDDVRLYVDKYSNYLQLFTGYFMENIEKIFKSNSSDKSIELLDFDFIIKAINDYKDEYLTFGTHTYDKGMPMCYLKQTFDGITSNNTEK